MKILISSEKNPALEEILNTCSPDSEIVFASDTQRIREQIQDAEVLIPERLKVDKEILDITKRMKLIHCGTGYNNVDLNETKRKNILVATTPGVVAQSVAEHVFSFIHQFYKRTSELDKSMKNDLWSKEEFAPYYELAGKTIGLIGFGDIGKRVARIAEAYDMPVLVHRRRKETEGFNIKIVGLDDLLRESDIVSVHVPATNETKSLIGNKEFDLMKRTAYLINTARGSIVDEGALAHALKEGKIAGAGIDVFVEEPLPEKSILRQLPNIILTPHTAYYTQEALGRRYRAYSENIKRLEHGLPLLNLV